MMEKQTTFNRYRCFVAAIVMCCFASVGSAQNLLSTLGETWNGSDWQNAYLSVNTYDASDYLTGTVSQLWTAPPGEWDNAIQYIYTNNATGAATQVLTEVWDADAAAWMTSQRITNTLNGADQVLTSITEMWTGTAWMNLSKRTNTYGSGFLTSTLVETWDFFAGNWGNSTFTTYTNNSEGAVTQSVTQTWNPVSSAWDNMSRSTYTYNAEGKELTELEEDWVGGAWQNDQQTLNEYVDGWLSVSLLQNWSQGSSAWQNDSQSLFTNNDDGTPAQIVVQEWNFNVDILGDGTGSWENSTRITFTYEALRVNGFTEKTFQLYPNPSSDVIRVMSDATQQSPYTIVDQRGKIVQTGVAINGETSVDISTLSSGIYYMRFNGYAKGTVKFIKQ